VSIVPFVVGRKWGEGKTSEKKAFYGGNALPDQLWFGTVASSGPVSSCRFHQVCEKFQYLVLRKCK
jgi:hypothetical protein